VSPASCLQIWCSAQQTQKACLETKAVLFGAVITTVTVNKSTVAVIVPTYAFINPASAAINAISLTPWMSSVWLTDPAHIDYAQLYAVAIKVDAWLVVQQDWTYGTNLTIAKP